jgi:hypothetical protein
MTDDPGTRLKALLEKLKKERKVDRTWLGKQMKPPVNYQTILRWTKNVGFNEENQQQVVRVLELPLDYFAFPDRVAEREARRRAILAEFYATTYGATAKDDERLQLESVPFRLPHIQPTVVWYEFNLGLLRGEVPPHKMDGAIQRNEDLDQAIARDQESKRLPKTDPKRLPKTLSGTRKLPT